MMTSTQTAVVVVLKHHCCVYEHERWYEPYESLGRWPVVVEMRRVRWRSLDDALARSRCRVHCSKHKTQASPIAVATTQRWVRPSHIASRTATYQCKLHYLLCFHLLTTVFYAPHATKWLRQRLESMQPPIRPLHCDSVSFPILCKCAFMT